MSKTRIPKTIEDLRPAQWNPREITAGALEGLGASLDQFGDIAGIVYNVRTGNLVCGHQRVEALKSTYGEELIYQPRDGEQGNIISPDGEAYTVRLVDWDKTTEKAAALAPNATTIQGDFTGDINALLEELGETMDEQLFDDLGLGELEIPEPKAPRSRGSRGERQVSIWLSEEELQRIRGTLDRWAERAGVTVEVK